MEHPIRPMEPERWPEPFDDPAWQFEIKWDGVRCISVCSAAGVRMYGRKGSDWTGRFPEVEEGLAGVRGVLDGELVVLEDGKPSFPAMLRRLHRQRGPLHYMVFDRLEDGAGRDLRSLALPLRQAELPAFSRETVRRVPAVQEFGRGLFRAAQETGLEGVVAKRLDAPYVFGKSPLWRKVKCWRTLYCVVTGVAVERGDVRSVSLGLDGAAIGSVGGLSRSQGAELLAARQRGEELRCKVAYIEWTPDGQLRHPRWQGLATT